MRDNNKLLCSSYCIYLKIGDKKSSIKNHRIFFYLYWLIEVKCLLQVTVTILINYVTFKRYLY